MRQPTLPPDGWQYRHVPLHRSEPLMLRASLDELIADIVASVAICDVDFKEPCDEAKREKVTANRISFRLCPINIGGRDAADRLLNGAYGLRAHYCLSPEEGSRATGVICRALADAIHAHTIGTTGNIAKQHIAELSQLLGGSLTKSSAKVWFDASVDKRPPAIDDGEVMSSVWNRSRAEPEELETVLPLSPQQIEVSLAKGRTVPLPATLDVKAAFVTANGTEYVPLSKRTRALQIHLMGWT